MQFQMIIMKFLCRPKTKKACLECLKDSYLFCESCSAPYCSEVCQKKNWSEHCLKCMAMP